MENTKQILDMKTDVINPTSQKLNFYHLLQNIPFKLIIQKNKEICDYIFDLYFSISY